MQWRRMSQQALGVAALLWVAAAPDAWSQTPTKPTAVARDYVQQNKQRFGLTGSDVNEMVVSSEVASRHNGVTHVYLQQQYRGIDVQDGIINVSVAADGTVISAGSRFVANIAAAAGGQSAKKAATSAAAAAAAHLKLKPTTAFTVLRRRAGRAEAATLSDGGVAMKPIDARLVWLASDRSLRLAWRLEIEEVSGEHWWNAFVDAETGASLGAVRPDRPRFGERHRGRDRASGHGGGVVALVPADRWGGLPRVPASVREPQRRRSSARDERRGPRRLPLRLARHERRRGPGVHPDPRQQRPRLRRPRQQQRGRPRNRSRRRPDPRSSTSRSTSAPAPSTHSRRSSPTSSTGTTSSTTSRTGTASTRPRATSR